MNADSVRETVVWIGKMGKKNKGIKPFKFDYPIIDNLKNQKIKQPEYVDVFSNSISMNNGILDILDDSKTSEGKRKIIIESNYEYIINTIYNQTDDFLDIVNSVFLNTTNINIFINITRTKVITDTIRRCVCKICSDNMFLESTKSRSDLEILGLFEREDLQRI